MIDELTYYSVSYDADHKPSINLDISAIGVQLRPDNWESVGDWIVAKGYEVYRLASSGLMISQSDGMVVGVVELGSYVMSKDSKLFIERADGLYQRWTIQGST